MIKEVIFIIIAYFLGTISPAYFFGKLYKKDLRKAKSKNLGAANVYLNFGFLPAALVFIIDIVKGVIAVILASYYGLTIIPLTIVAIAAILGHDFPFYLKFHGGKGTATTLGVCVTLLIRNVIYKLNILHLIISLIVILAIYFIAKFIIIKTQKRPYWI